jgi:mitogen-activated protein kinase 1/3
MKRLDKIGEGSYGVVYSANYKSSINENSEDEEKLVAIKRNFKETTSSWIGNVHEADILARLRGHPFVVEIQRFAYGDPFQKQKPMTPNLANERKMNEDKIHFVLEHATHSGDTYLSSDKFSFYNSKIILCQVLLSLEYIHNKHIIHRDLKPANILINYDSQGLPIAKLCDFGMSSQHCKAIPSTPGVVTHWYRAPEICFKHSDYDYASDMWSFGCLMFEFVSKRAWLHGTDDSDIKTFNTIYSRLEEYPSEEDLYYLKSKSSKPINISMESRTKKRFSYQSHLKLTSSEVEEFNKKGGDIDDFCDLMRRCLQINPKKRISISDALDHPFFEIFQSYIKDVRKVFPPVGPGPCHITIHDCLERKWAINVAFEVFNDRDDIVWYKEAVLFHALDLFDRYLEWAFKPTNDKVELEEEETAYKGRLHSKEETELRFYVCLYIMHKYYSTLIHPLNWKNFVPPRLREDLGNEAIAENFEFLLIKNVCNYKIFRETFLELIDKFNHYSDNASEFMKFIRHLLDVYGRCGEYIGTIEGLYRMKNGLNIGDIEIETME